MKAIKHFEEFLREGVVKTCYPDKSRANFLIKESVKDYKFINEFLEKIGLRDDNANTLIKSTHDAIMGMIRAKMLINGFNASGSHAHESEVAYLRLMEFNENEVQFMDQLRYSRNGTMYYGIVFDKEYAERVLNFLRKIYPQLKKLVSNSLKK
jgi:hypothetical protein